MKNKYRGKIDCTEEELSEILEEYRDCRTACPIDKKGWVYGSLIDGDKPYIVGQVRESIPHGGIVLDYWYPVKKETVGQYTGKNDMHTNEIYEGDIVQSTSWNTWFTLTKNKEMQLYTRVYEVVFHNGAYCLKEKKVMYWRLDEEMAKANLLIIGNIYDNPELIEVRE